MSTHQNFPTYAQYHEDVILAALLSDVKKGFYIDIGANYPTIDSVTKHFYDQGWTGINIEPIPSLYEQLTDERPNDLNLQIGIGKKESKLTFYENVTIPGHSSFDYDQAATVKGSQIKEYEINVLPLARVILQYKVKHVHFLKIDVEGFESEVIAGMDWKKVRPEVICIEANHRSDAWQKDLISKGYIAFINDGLNEYYIAKEAKSRMDDFADKVVKLDYDALRQHQYEYMNTLKKQLNKVTKLNETHHQLLQESRSHNQRLARLSLEGVGIGARIKRSVYGMTIDWLRYKGILK